MATTDTLGVTIEVGDTCRVAHWGYGVRVTDTGRVVTVVGFNRNGNVLVTDDASNAHNPTANGRALRGGCLGVLRRDGGNGFEGNA